MNTLCYEVKSEIFKYIKNPISLALVNRTWYTVFRDPHVRSEWFLSKYGRAHALFHAIRLGRNFLTLDVIKCLIAKKAIVSRYFVQRLLSQCGNEILFELGNTLNIKHEDDEDIKKLNFSQKNHWGYDLSVNVLKYILEEAIKLYGTEIYMNGNDFELLHFLTASFLSSERIRDNMEQIKDLILNNKFIPFPPSTNSSKHEHPRSDGYENIHQLNILAHVIVLYPDLVKLWKQIGYHEICKDTNCLVIRGVYSLSFPHNTDPHNRVRPDENAIFERLKTFIDLGFKLDYKAMRAVIYLFRDRISEVDQIVFKSFSLFCDDKSLVRFIFMRYCSKFRFKDGVVRSS
ncbi:hypothetical protein GLOIN_2v1793189 [Rhizophagus clarus]|uniref:F-box domain-containing protein n=1 Tax=Rhizophagus clarus TaxID=94130 RepID=A0A8H3LUZ5_9GLOM|nr:hypothetical protein GLOIN_2v1793189 [Rhizophagus clarus]